MNESLLVELVKMTVQTAFMLNLAWEGVFFDWDKRVFYVHYYGRERLTVAADFFANPNPRAALLEASKRLKVRQEAKVMD